MVLGESLGALRERQFRLLYAGQTLSNLGLVLLASRLPQVLLVLAGGVAGDRLPRRQVMLASDAVRCVTQATTAVLLATGTARLWQLLVLQGAHGAAAAFFDPAATGLVPQTVSSGRLQQANALMGLSRSATGILGQIGAGVLVAAVGPALALAVDAASFAVSAWSLALLRPTGTVCIGQGATFLAQLAAGWAEFRSRSWLWASVLHLALLNLVVLAPFFVLGPLVALRSLGGPVGWAMIATAYATGAVAGGLVGLRWRPRRPLLASVLVIFALAPLIAGLALAASIPVLAVAGFLGGLQASLHEVLWTTSLQQHVPAEALSRVSAYGWLGALVFAPLGYALAGPVSNWIGVAATLWVGAGWVLLSTGAVLAVPGIRRLRRTDLLVASRSAGCL